jgi:hypothetical protein
MGYPHRNLASARTSYLKRAVFYECFLSLLGVRCGGLARVTMWVIHTDVLVILFICIIGPYVSLARMEIREASHINNLLSAEGATFKWRCLSALYWL